MRNKMKIKIYMNYDLNKSQPFIEPHDFVYIIMDLASSMQPFDVGVHSECLDFCWMP